MLVSRVPRLHWRSVAARTYGLGGGLLLEGAVDGIPRDGALEDDDVPVVPRKGALSRRQAHAQLDAQVLVLANDDSGEGVLKVLDIKENERERVRVLVAYRQARRQCRVSGV